MTINTNATFHIFEDPNIILFNSFIEEIISPLGLEYLPVRVLLSKTFRASVRLFTTKIITSIEKRSHLKIFSSTNSTRIDINFFFLDSVLYEVMSVWALNSRLKILALL